MIRAAHLKFSKDKFWCSFGWRETSLSASSGLCGRALYHRVHNYASRQTKCSDISMETPPLSGFFVAFWPVPNRDLRLTGRVVLLTVVSNLLTGARLYEFSRHLEYYLWYTLANSPIGFWSRLNLTIAMGGHLFKHSSFTIRTTTLPNIYVWGKL